MKVTVTPVAELSWVRSASGYVPRAGSTCRRSVAVLAWREISVP